MPEIDEQTLERVITKVLNAREARHEHDELMERRCKFVDELIDREQRRRDAWKKFKMSFIGGLALAVLGFLGWVGTLIVEFFRHGPPPGGAQ